MVVNQPAHSLYEDLKAETPSTLWDKTQNLIPFYHGRNSTAEIRYSLLGLDEEYFGGLGTVHISNNYMYLVVCLL